jgi:hypothetical protein
LKQEKSPNFELIEWFMNNQFTSFSIFETISV